jgi:branched-chain amino acid transport system substrate-binding protein
MGATHAPRRIVGIALTFAVSAAAAVSCAPRGPVRIGLAAGLTGTSPDAAISVRKAVELAVRDAEASGGIRGRRIELVVRDDGDSPDTMLEVLREFDRRGIDIVVGPVLSVSLPKAYEYARERGMLLVSPTVSSDEYTDKDDHLIRLSTPNAAQGPFTADRMLAHGFRRVAVAVDATNPAYTGGLARSFMDRFAGAGGELVAVAAIDPERRADIPEAAKRLLEGEPDAIFASASGLGAAYLCQALGSLGSDIPCVGISWATTGELIELGGASAERMEIPMLYDLGSEAPEFTAFRDSMRSLFGEEPSYTAIISYEAASVLFEAMRRCGSSAAAPVRREMLSGKTFRGLQGDIVFDRFGDVYRFGAWYGIRAGAYVKLAD